MSYRCQNICYQRETHGIPKFINKCYSLSNNATLKQEHRQITFEYNVSLLHEHRLGVGVRKAGKVHKVLVALLRLAHDHGLAVQVQHRAVLPVHALELVRAFVNADRAFVITERGTFRRGSYA